MSKAGILIADPNYLVREGIKLVFNSDEGFEVIGETTDYDHLPELIRSHQPRIVVIGLNVKGFSVIEKIEEVLRDFPEQKVLVIDTNEDKYEIIQILQLGVHAYILKDCDRDEILEAGRSILNNKRFFCSNVIKVNHDAKTGIQSKLSEREIEILKLIAEGLTNNEIAYKIFLSPHTVATHRKNLMRKLDAKNNVDLVIGAIKESIIAP